MSSVSVRLWSVDVVGAAGSSAGYSIVSSKSVAGAAVEDVGCCGADGADCSGAVGAEGSGAEVACWPVASARGFSVVRRGLRSRGLRAAAADLCGELGRSGSAGVGGSGAWFDPWPLRGERSRGDPWETPSG